MPKPRKLPGHVRARLHRQLAGGWLRAVFARPLAQGDHEAERDERVLAGPGLAPADAPLPDFETQLAALIDACEQAAAQGLVKQTFVLDERRRLELDTRHGHIKARTLDDATLDKVMAGKQRVLRPDRSAALLQAIGIMNADGTISARNAKKYKQVNHLVELCRPTWEKLATTRKITPEQPLRIVDLACGNSYLAFVLLEALRVAELADSGASAPSSRFAQNSLPARLLGVDVRDDVITSSRERAAQIGFGERARFVAARLEQLSPAQVEAELGGPPDLALALHACDAATDAALALAIRAGVGAILAVPCCQAELARTLPASLGERLVPALLEQGLLRRSLGELLTDALRIEILDACGYSVTTLEFVDSEHTPKNLLIRAHRRGRGSVDRASWKLAAVQARCDALGLAPTLLRLLDG